jgi:hypothetical protein
MTHHLN